MQETSGQPASALARADLGGAVRDFATLTFAAFEVLADRQYAAPWRLPASTRR